MRQQQQIELEMRQQQQQQLLENQRMMNSLAAQGYSVQPVGSACEQGVVV